MNYLVVYMHPTRESFNSSVLERVVNTLQEAKVNVSVRNLSEESFQPHLTRKEYEDSFERIYSPDILKEQEFIKWADHIIMIFPVWWGGFPAMGKGYIDRVFSYGFAYTLDGETPIPKLKGKKTSLLYSTGAPKEEFFESRMNEAMIHLIDHSILKFCGLSLHGTLHFGNVIQCSDQDREKMLQKTSLFINKL